MLVRQMAVGHTGPIEIFEATLSACAAGVPGLC
jgi:hypothetical protein